MREQMTGDINQPVRFFGLFTWKDLIRLTLPTALVLWRGEPAQLASFSDVAAILFTAVLGLIWYGWRPQRQPVDSHLYHLLRWLLIRVTR